MRQRNIALIGFRATGKSTVGEILALKLGRSFIDMDRRLAHDAGRDIAAWVKLNGWDSFRRAESGLLEILRQRQGLVVATGGGIVLDRLNFQTLREDFLTIWLKATRQTIIARLNADPDSPLTRPALSCLSPAEEIEKTLSERNPLYSEVANLVIDTEEKPPAHIAEEIYRLLNDS
ncbi:MAG: shikimate kinase [Syntrophobacteraceae bacterium]|nr:shikimate kinase [Syntrophobacteraceae bacterium]